ncbi:MAG: hypothetical protein JKX75_05485 [Gammaproteobacteria bacterium]|nr:hypothetical protein [Gammaproteobacteria bacterium]
MAGQVDKITEPQEWIDGLMEKYSPGAHDVNIVAQNMGLKINALEDRMSQYLAHITAMNNERTIFVEVVEKTMENPASKVAQMTLKRAVEKFREDGF